MKDIIGRLFTLKTYVWQHDVTGSTRVEKTEGVIGEDEESQYSLNVALVPKFSNRKEAADFLVRAIRYWKDKGLFVCTYRETFDNAFNKAEGCSFRMFRSKPNDCECCEAAGALILKVMSPRFRRLRFVKSYAICDCGCGHILYWFMLRDLEVLTRS